MEGEEFIPRSITRAETTPSGNTYAIIGGIGGVPSQLFIKHTPSYKSLYWLPVFIDVSWPSVGGDAARLLISQNVIAPPIIIKHFLQFSLTIYHQGAHSIQHHRLPAKFLDSSEMRPIAIELQKGRKPSKKGRSTVSKYPALVPLTLTKNSSGRKHGLTTMSCPERAQVLGFKRTLGLRWSLTYYRSPSEVTLDPQGQMA